MQPFFQHKELERLNRKKNYGYSRARVYNSTKSKISRKLELVV
jgi:hypothetical protein